MTNNTTIRVTIKRMWKLVRMWYVIHLFEHDSPTWKWLECKKEAARELDELGFDKKMPREHYNLAVKMGGSIRAQKDHSEPVGKRSALVFTYIRKTFPPVWGEDSERFKRRKENANKAIQMAIDPPYQLLELTHFEHEPDVERIRLTSKGRMFSFTDLLILLLEKTKPLAEGISTWKQLLFGALGGGGIVGIIIYFINLFW